MAYDLLMRLTENPVLAAAQAIADFTPPGNLVLYPLDEELHQAVTRAVALKAVEQDLARAEYVPYLD